MKKWIGFALAVAGLWIGHELFFGETTVTHCSRVDVDMRMIRTQLKTFYVMNGRLPTTEEGLEALITRPAAMASSKHWRQLFAELPVDPWGNAYQYACPGWKPDRGFDVYSLGPDGVPSEDDVYNKIN